ncbi:uncharacterized protein LOC132749376 [Ruditapes philippinarum]|uniref:uncharacterized protein LOC132749376 n=1 Tax=Ruditapes philippinarum TaxID=129788 RepID=UPI00295B48AD|nr:uncharacterized protein LOC132749376 [Ruditapes philippinarum]
MFCLYCVYCSEAWRRQKIPSLIDGLPSERDFRSDEVQQALEEISMEESRQKYELHGGQSTGTNTVSPVIQNENEAGTSQLPSSPDSVRGAEGGAPRVEEANDDITILKEVESLLTSHQRQLGGAVIPLRVSRENILEKLIVYYSEEDLATSRITVKFIGEEGMDCGGVTNEMFTTFWYRAQEEFFIGCEAVVPYLPPQRFTDDSKYQVLGRILSHSIAVMKEFPIHMCKSTIIAMIYETTDVSAENLFEDFLYFLDSHDRNLVTTAINNYSSLTSDQADELMTIFERYEYAIKITAENFRYHVTQLARHVLCIRPKPLLEKMRSGIPKSHMERFWSNVHLKTVSVLFRALKPTPERVIARLKTPLPLDSGIERMVFGFLKDLLTEMTTPELETFLQFVTGKKSVPREKITIKIKLGITKLRLPMVHTCSNMLKLPYYIDYETFRSEFKHLLASDKALKMSMV